MGNQQPNLKIEWCTNYERQPVIPSIENYTANRPPEPPHPEWIKSCIAPMPKPLRSPTLLPPKVPESLDESLDESAPKASGDAEVKESLDESANDPIDESVSESMKEVDHPIEAGEHKEKAMTLDHAEREEDEDQEHARSHPVKKPKLTANEQEHPMIPGPMKKPRLECIE